MSSLPAYVHSLLDKIAIDEGFTDVSKDFQVGTNHGDNFSGVLTSVVLRGNRNGLANGELHLLCKLPPANEYRREAFQSISVFRRETVAYNDILPTFLAFQQAKGVSAGQCFTSYPRCYAAVADEQLNQFVVIMEDLRPKGYIMRPKSKLIDLDHSRLVMEQLGRFHGISFALKEQQPDTFARFTQLNDVFSQISESTVVTMAIENAYRRGENSIGNAEKLAKVKHLLANWREVIKFALSAESTRFAVVTHGDVWNNNLLYTYNQEKKVQAISLVDWQVCRYASPVIDILFNIFSSTDGCFRTESYQNLIEHYHRSLSRTIRQLGSDPDQLFSFDDLQNELKLFGKFAILCTPLLLRVMLANPEDIRNYEQMKTSDEEVNDGNNHYHLDANADGVFRKRFSDIVDDVINYGYY